MTERAWMLLAGTGIAIAFLTLTAPLAETSPSELPVVLSIETKRIPLLVSHGHEAHNAVSDQGHGVSVRTAEVMVEQDVWVRGIRVVVDNAPRVTLHHANVVVVPPIAGDPDMETFSEFGEVYGFSVGQDIAETLTLTRPYAVFIPKGARISFAAMLHNPDPPKGPGGTYEDVRVSAELLGIDFDARNAKRIRQIYLTLVDVGSPGNDSFKVPAGTNRYTRYAEDEHDAGRARYVFPTNGTLVDMSAHLHAWEGGRRIDAYLNGVKIHTFIPERVGPELWEWRTERTTLMRRVKTGDVLTLSATYSNEGSVPLEGAMGSLGTSFAPDLSFQDTASSNSFAEDIGRFFQGRATE